MVIRCFNKRTWLKSECEYEEISVEKLLAMPLVIYAKQNCCGKGKYRKCYGELVLWISNKIQMNKYFKVILITSYT